MRDASLVAASSDMVLSRIVLPEFYSMMYSDVAFLINVTAALLSPCICDKEKPFTVTLESSMDHSAICRLPIRLYCCQLIKLHNANTCQQLAVLTNGSEEPAISQLSTRKIGNICRPKDSRAKYLPLKMEPWSFCPSFVSVNFSMAQTLILTYRFGNQNTRFPRHVLLHAQLAYFGQSRDIALDQAR